MPIQEVVAIMDRSGSMIGKEDDTIGGINAAITQLKEQRIETQDTTNIKISIKLFDHQEYLLIRSMNIDKVRPIEKRQYVPRGQTALLDAIGNTLTYFINKKIIDENAYENCLVYIITDGHENASRYYTQQQIKDLISNAETNYNIKIVYLAANQDAILEANRLGIDQSQALNYSETPENVESAYRSAASAAYRQRTGTNVGFTQAERLQSSSNPNANNNLSVDVSSPDKNINMTHPPPVKRRRSHV
jgi:uncharacterized protein YegL